jgi:hypothetical protein
VIKYANIIKILILFLIPSIFTVPLSAQMTVEERAEYLQGVRDGRLASHSNIVWIAAGFCLPVGSSIATLFVRPDPPPEALLGKSQYYIKGYTRGYKNRTVLKNLRSTFIGSCAICVILVVYDSQKEEDCFDRNFSCGRIDDPDNKSCGQNCSEKNISWTLDQLGM